MTENKEFNLKFNLSDESGHKALVVKYVVYFFLVVLLYGVISLSALSTYSSNANIETSHYFFENSPDLIAVFTGDKGRLEYAFSLLAKYPECKLLISGVYSKNTLLSLIQLKKINLPPQFNEEALSQVVELDYQAQNTLENVFMTMQMIKKNQTYKKILIVSSDYHLLRIKLLFSYFQKVIPEISIYYLGVRSESNFFGRILDASKESFKILQTLGMLLFLSDGETTTILNDYNSTSK